LAKLITQPIKAVCYFANIGLVGVLLLDSSNKRCHFKPLSHGGNGAPQLPAGFADNQ
jgi:hypothetical protein